MIMNEDIQYGYKSLQDRPLRAGKGGYYPEADSLRSSLRACLAVKEALQSVENAEHPVWVRFFIDERLIVRESDSRATHLGDSRSRSVYYNEGGH